MKYEFVTLMVCSNTGNQKHFVKPMQPGAEAAVI